MNSLFLFRVDLAGSLSAVIEKNKPLQMLRPLNPTVHLLYRAAKTLTYICIFFINNLKNADGALNKLNFTPLWMTVSQIPRIIKQHIFHKVAVMLLRYY